MPALRCAIFRRWKHADSFVFLPCEALEGQGRRMEAASMTFTSQTFAPTNSECLDCPLKGSTAPCSRLMEVWRVGKIRRPEFVRSLALMMAQHPEARCNILKPDIEAIESRLMPDRLMPDRKPVKVAPVAKVHEDASKPAQITNSQGIPVPATLIGRLPRRDNHYSLRSER